MAYKHIVLKILYCSLGIAVAAGVTALFTGVDNDVIRRLIGTSLLTSAGTGLLLLSIKYSDSDATKQLSVCISILTYLAYFFFLTAIWCYLFRGDEDVFAMSGLMILASSTPLLIGSCLMGIERSKFAGRILVSVWAVLMLWWIIDVMSNPNRFAPSVNYTTPIALYGSMFAVMCLLHKKALIFIGIVPLLVAFISTEIIAHFHIIDIEVSSLHWKITIVASWIAASLSLPNVLYFRLQKYQTRILERVTTIAIVLALGFIALLVYHSITYQETPEWQLRFASGFGIIASTGILGTLVWQSIQVYMIPKANSSFLLEVNCPRCRNQLGLYQGKNHCPYCDLFMQINFEAPNCSSCHYDLTKSKSETCPECGNEVMIESLDA